MNYKIQIVEQNGEKRAVGPRGELRPLDELQATTMSLQVATSVTREEYIDEEHRLATENRKRHIMKQDKDGNWTEEIVTRQELRERDERAKENHTEPSDKWLNQERRYASKDEKGRFVLKTGTNREIRDAVEKFKREQQID